jgi:hypothetical protein
MFYGSWTGILLMLEQSSSSSHSSEMRALPWKFASVVFTALITFFMANPLAVQSEKLFEYTNYGIKKQKMKVDAWYFAIEIAKTTWNEASFSLAVGLKRSFLAPWTGTSQLRNTLKVDHESHELSLYP